MLQPMDVAVFRSFKEKYRKEIKEHFQTGGGTLTREEKRTETKTRQGEERKGRMLHLDLITFLSTFLDEPKKKEKNDKGLSHEDLFDDATREEKAREGKGRQGKGKGKGREGKGKGREGEGRVREGKKKRKEKKKNKNKNKNKPN